MTENISDVIKPKKRDRKYLTAEQATKHLPNGGGRQLGSKNKTTIFKEVIREGFEERLQKDGMRVVDAVIAKAIGAPSKDKEGNNILDEDGKKIYRNGDMQAAKLLFDRILPTSKAIDLDKLEQAKGISINISIGELTREEEAINGEFEEI